MKPRTVWSLKDARGELERLLGMNLDWAPLDRLLAEFLVEPELRKTALASSFTATLEMTREGAAGNPPGEIVRAALGPPPRTRRMTMICIEATTTGPKDDSEAIE